MKILDHGYLRVVDAWGGDKAIIEAARQSTQGGFRGWETDAKLLRYLWRNQHSTPFEFAGLVVDVQAPLIVFREWHRHRTWSYSEASARYAPLPSLDYLPTVDRLLDVDTSNKQAGAVAGAPTLTYGEAEAWRNELGWLQGEAQRLYQHGLDVGVPKELARLALTVGRYSRMRAQANLRNLLAFVTLRSAPNAQYEIRAYADALAGIIAERFPRTWEVYEGTQT